MKYPSNLLIVCLIWLGLTHLNACNALADVQYPLAEDYWLGDSFMQIRLSGTLRLPLHKVDGFKVTELSGLAWDEDEQLLYAISDRGTLYHIQVSIVQQRLQKATVLKALKLKNAQGRDLARRKRDSEALLVRQANNGIRGDTELLVAFEVHPRVLRFTPQGEYLGAQKLPKVLRNIKNYRSKNKSLESLAEHPKYGLLTAPEWPLRKMSKNRTRLYAQQGFWEWDAYPAPNSAVVALEMLDTQHLLVMERAFTSVFQPLIISLRKVQLNPACMNGKHDCHVKNLAILDNSQGWHIDNFEGLSRHQGAFFFMVSDDNESTWQHTLLSYFELLKQPQALQEESSHHAAD